MYHTSLQAKKCGEERAANTFTRSIAAIFSNEQAMSQSTSLTGSQSGIFLWSIQNTPSNETCSKYGGRNC
jgi:hypothetical protein